MQLTLVISGLLDLSESSLASIDEGAPALTRLLAAAGAPAVDRDGSIGVICTALGIAKQRDWPVAPWLARGAGIAATAAYWLCAEPATFEVGRGDVSLSGTVTDLEPVETTALLSSLNAHFAREGVRFDAPHAAHWLAGCVATQSLSTQPPESVIGKPLLGHLMEGTDGGRWRSWQNEIQMLLFEHPVNVAREAAGRAVVNSVWLLGWRNTRFGKRSRTNCSALRQRADTTRTRARHRRVNACPFRLHSTHCATNRRNRPRWSGSTRPLGQIRNSMPTGSLPWIEIGQRRRVGRFTMARSKDSRLS